MAMNFYLHRCPEIATSSIDLVQVRRLLPEDGDRTHSPKRCLK
jgi:hypothetical protein